MSRIPVITLLLVCAGLALAQQPVNYTKRPIQAKKATTPPTIDGDISDPVWKDAPKAETFIDVQNGNVTTEQTTAWLLYDEKYIYVAFHAKDSQPEKIVARETVRD